MPFNPPVQVLLFRLFHANDFPPACSDLDVNDAALLRGCVDLGKAVERRLHAVQPARPGIVVPPLPCERLPARVFETDLLRELRAVRGAVDVLDSGRVLLRLAPLLALREEGFLIESERGEHAGRVATRATPDEELPVGLAEVERRRLVAV